VPPASLQPFVTHWRRWIALAALFGVVVMSLPLVEAWRRQGLELRTAADARRALAASAQAVQMQRALAAHRPFAAAVLSGRTEQEAERLRRQQVVDSESGTLVGLLEAHQLHRALDETDQFRLDWSSLLEGIGRRKITPAASDAAHDLLAEQTFVIMDLIGSAGRLSGQVGRALHGDEWLLALQTLPRLAIALAAAADDGPAGHAAPGNPSDAAASIRTQAARAARATAEVLRAAEARSAEPGSPAPDPALVRALVAVQQHAAAIANLQQASEEARRAAMPLIRRARAAAVDANAALFARLDADLADFATAQQAQRLETAAAGLVALLAGVLAAALAFPVATRSAEDGAPAPDEEGDVDDASDEEPSAATRPESHGPAADLLERLRRPDPGPAAGTSPAPGADPPARRPG